MNAYRNCVNRHDRLAWCKEADGKVPLWGRRFWAAFEDEDKPMQATLRLENVRVYIELEDLIRRVCAEKEASAKEEETA